MGYRLMIRVFVIFQLFILSAVAATVEQYLPKEQQYDQEFIKPEQSLGFGLGERHIRHDQLVHYLEGLAQQSPRIQLTNIGYTKEMRKQLLLTISAPENLAKLPQLLQNRNNTDAAQPLVIWLGYSVHGDETSGSNAALAIAYYLAASMDKSVEQMLSDSIIVIEPSVNPDGMDRFVNWVNTYRGTTANADPNHIEHHQGWRTGRTNHFGFDLNRDWLLVTQQETKNRLRYFHQYQPDVLGDFHEMGANGSYFFQPGIPTRTHPLTPKRNTELTQLLATFHAKALDQDNRLYYSQESFDDFYYGKGSTYPDINGGVGILFEQASSRGFVQESVNGLLTFEYGIQNHVYTSLSTINGAWQNKQQFKAYRRKFYQEALDEAREQRVTGYLLTEQNDSYRFNHFLSTLKQHQIEVYPLTEDFRSDGKLFQKENSYYLPLVQKQYRVIQALFNQEQQFQDNTFYDVSGWTMPLAMDINFQPVKRTWGLDIAKTPWQMPAKHNINIDQQAYAYAFEWHDFLAPKLLNQLLNHGVQAKVANRSFTAQTITGEKSFAAGSILIPAAIQQQAQWRAIVAQTAQQSQIKVYSITTGLTSKGIDLGSGSMQKIEPVKALLIGGKNSSQYEAAEVLYYLDELLGIPVTVVEQNRLSEIDLAQYSHLLMIDGVYQRLSKATVGNIKAWLKNGGVVFAQKRAGAWLAEQEIVTAKFVSKEGINELFDTDGLRYQDKERLAARKRIAGAIFESELDLSHPLTYGYTDSQLPLFRNSSLIIDSYNQPFVTVASYSATPLMSGFTDQTLVNRIARNPAIVAHNYGKGRVIVSLDDLVFRGYWLGSAKILANSLFFAKAFNTPVQ